jgi:hypothetical protein
MTDRELLEAILEKLEGLATKSDTLTILSKLEQLEKKVNFEELVFEVIRK